jgi:PAS domain S-box-containing protein
MDSRIVLWTRGAQQLYGYSKEAAIGKSSHELLQTQFPFPIRQIEEALHRAGTWEGELRHSTRDGRSVHVASHWVLHHDLRANPLAFWKSMPILPN